jgi:hypothetical protein
MATKVLNGLDLSNTLITNLGTPSATSDAATKGYVDGLVAGLSWKDEVRVATTANGTLATAFANGQTVDGVTLATNDRILVKNQTTQSENGIYIVQASGAPVRATDADSSAELVNAAVFVSAGTTNADTAWVQTANAPITVNTTALVFSQFGAGGSAITAGNGLTGTSTFDVGAGTGISVAADAVSIDTAVVVRKFAGNVGNGSLTSIPITHNLNTRDITWALYDATTFAFVETDGTATDANTLTLVFATAPTSNQYRVVVHA